MGKRAVDQQAEVIVAAGQRQRVWLKGELLFRQLELGGRGTFLRQENQNRLIGDFTVGDVSLMKVMVPPEPE